MCKAGREPDMSLRKITSINTLNAFLRNKSGNYGMIAAILMGPIMACVGAAIDYSSYYNLRSNLQNAVDSAALAAAKEFAYTLETSKLEAYAEEYFFTNYHGEFEASDINFDLTMSAGSGLNQSGESLGLALKATATTDYEYVFGQFLGLETSDVNVSATVGVANKTIEAAFVFDASGSMTDNDTFQKSTKAAHDMLHDLKQFALRLTQATGANTEYARYALVPFAWGVNVGAGSRGSSWIDNDGLAKHHHDYFDWVQAYPNAKQNSQGWKAGATRLQRFKLFDDLGEDWGGCVDARAHPYNLDDTAAVSSDPDTLFVPMFAPDEPDNKAGGEVDYTNDYLDDVVIDNKTSITLDNTNSGNKTRQFDRLAWTSKYNTDAAHKKSDNGPNKNCFGYEIFALNDDFGLTNAEIAHLNNTFASSKTIGSGDDDGATNIQQGVVWGWRTLSSSEPFSEGRSENDPTNQKVMIVITDGINSYSSSTNLTESEYGTYGYLADDRLKDSISIFGGKSTSEIMDELTLESCDGAKRDGINVFVVGYGVVQNSAADQLLASCAGGQEDKWQYYFSVNDSDISDAMNTILRQLLDIRLTS